MVAEEFEHAARALGLAVGQDAAARLERGAAEVVGAIALRAVDAVEECGDIDHLRAVLEVVAVDDGALRERGRRGGHARIVRAGNASSGEFRGGAAHEFGVELVDLEALADAAQHGDGQASPEMLAELLEPAQQRARIGEERVPHGEAEP
jgi:hypothetical protein